MIINVIKKDIFKSSHGHIVFAINTDGINDSGFAGEVFSRFAPHLADTEKEGGRPLGDIVTVKDQDRVFYGLACYSLKKDRTGWHDTPDTILACLDKIDISEDEQIAVVLMGAGFIGTISGADAVANLQAIHQSKKKCVVYTLEFEYDEKEIFDMLGVNS